MVQDRFCLRSDQLVGIGGKQAASKEPAEGIRVRFAIFPIWESLRQPQIQSPARQVQERTGRFLRDRPIASKWHLTH